MALKGYEVTHFLPFDPVHKRTEATVRTSDGKPLYDPPREDSKATIATARQTGSECEHGESSR